jgi:hypothetical protein
MFKGFTNQVGFDDLTQVIHNVLGKCWFGSETLSPYVAKIRTGHAVQIGTSRMYSKSSTKYKTSRS